MGQSKTKRGHGKPDCAASAYHATNIPCDVNAEFVIVMSFCLSVKNGAWPPNADYKVRSSVAVGVRCCYAVKFAA